MTVRSTKGPSEEVAEPVPNNCWYTFNFANPWFWVLTLGIVLVLLSVRVLL